MFGDVLMETVTKEDVNVLKGDWLTDNVSKILSVVAEADLYRSLRSGKSKLLKLIWANLIDEVTCTDI
jgi:hypothetical protein